jgi:hypothetical protein
MDCEVDGHHMEAENDEELFKIARKHADEAHSELGLTDEQLRGIIAETAYDK